VGGAGGVVDAGATRSTGGGVGAASGVAKVVGAARGAAEVGEASDDGTTRGWRSDRQPLFLGRSGRLGSWSDLQPLFQAWSDRSKAWPDRQQRLATGSLGEPGVPAVVLAWEPHRERHPTERCLNH
jgi:hypothetical protein